MGEGGLLVIQATQEAEDHKFKTSWDYFIVYGMPYVLTSAVGKKIKLGREQGCTQKRDSVTYSVQGLRTHVSMETLEGSGSYC